MNHNLSNYDKAFDISSNASQWLSASVSQSGLSKKPSKRFGRKFNLFTALQTHGTDLGQKLTQGKFKEKPQLSNLNLLPIPVGGPQNFHQLSYMKSQQDSIMLKDESVSQRNVAEVKQADEAKRSQELWGKAGAPSKKAEPSPRIERKVQNTSDPISISTQAAPGGGMSLKALKKPAATGKARTYTFAQPITTAKRAERPAESEEEEEETSYYGSEDEEAESEMHEARGTEVDQLSDSMKNIAAPNKQQQAHVQQASINNQSLTDADTGQYFEKQRARQRQPSPLSAHNKHVAQLEPPKQEPTRPAVQHQRQQQQKQKQQQQKQQTQEPPQAKYHVKSQKPLTPSQGAPANKNLQSYLRDRFSPERDPVGQKDARRPQNVIQDLQSGNPAANRNSQRPETEEPKDNNNVDNTSRDKSIISDYSRMMEQINREKRGIQEMKNQFLNGIQFDQSDQEDAAPARVRAGSVGERDNRNDRAEPAATQPAQSDEQAYVDPAPVTAKRQVAQKNIYTGSREVSMSNITSMNISKSNVDPDNYMSSGFIEPEQQKEDTMKSLSMNFQEKQEVNRPPAPVVQNFFSAANAKTEQQHREMEKFQAQKIRELTDQLNQEEQENLKSQSQIDRYIADNQKLIDSGKQQSQIIVQLRSQLREAEEQQNVSIELQSELDGFKKLYADLKQEYTALATRDLNDVRRLPANLARGDDADNQQKENEFLKYRLSVLQEKLQDQDNQRLVRQNALMRTKINELESTVEDLSNANTTQLNNMNNITNMTQSHGDFQNFLTTQDLVTKHQQDLELIKKENGQLKQALGQKDQQLEQSNTEKEKEHQVELEKLNESITSLKLSHQQQDEAKELFLNFVQNKILNKINGAQSKQKELLNEQMAKWQNGDLELSMRMAEQYLEPNEEENHDLNNDINSLEQQQPSPGKPQLYPTNSKEHKFYSREVKGIMRQKQKLDENVSRPRKAAAQPQPFAQQMADLENVTRTKTSAFGKKNSHNDENMTDEEDEPGDQELLRESPTLNPSNAGILSQALLNVNSNTVDLTFEQNTSTPSIAEYNHNLSNWLTERQNSVKTDAIFQVFPDGNRSIDIETRPLDRTDSQAKLERLMGLHVNTNSGAPAQGHYKSQQRLHQKVITPNQRNINELKTSKAQRKEDRIAFVDFVDSHNESAFKGTLKRAASKSQGKRTTKKKSNKLGLPKPPKLQQSLKQTLKRNVSNNTRSSGRSRDASLKYIPQTLKSIAWASSRNLLLSEAGGPQTQRTQRQLPSFTKVTAPRAESRGSKSPVVWPYGKGLRASSQDNLLPKNDAKMILAKVRSNKRSDYRQYY